MSISNNTITDYAKHEISYEYVPHALTVITLAPDEVDTLKGILLGVLPRLGSEAQRLLDLLDGSPAIIPNTPATLTPWSPPPTYTYTWNPSMNQPRYVSLTSANSNFDAPPVDVPPPNRKERRAKKKKPG